MADLETRENEKQKHPGGRPLKYQTVDELDLAIQTYFDTQDPHIETHLMASGVSAKGETMFQERKVLTEQQPYTISGLARALGLTRQSILNYKDRDEFFDSIVAAKTKCEEYAEGQLFTGNANGAKFNLTNNHNGWSDKQVLAGDKDAPLMPVGLDAAILARRSGGEASSSPAADSEQ